jgi:hypothetical protein
VKISGSPSARQCRRLSVKISGYLRIQTQAGTLHLHTGRPYSAAGRNEGERPNYFRKAVTAGIGGLRIDV